MDPVQWSKTIQVKEEVEELNKSTTVLSTRMIFLTYVLVVLTAVLVVLTVVLVLKG